MGSRILALDAVVPFVQGTRLIVRRGMTGATGNIYAGLHEFEDMAFALHLLRAGDLFVDVGANVGSYTILAGSTGASCVSIEPIPSTYKDLLANVNINGMSDRVRTYQLGLGSVSGVRELTSDLDTMNHVVDGGESAHDTIKVEFTTLDSLLSDETPALLKVDVEGYESEVFGGAKNVLASPGLLAMIVELNGSNIRYGRIDQDVIQQLKKEGFEPYDYSPFERTLRRQSGRGSSRSGNSIFVRNLEQVLDRVRGASRISMLGTEF